jgi:hypothetical protein
MPKSRRGTGLGEHELYLAKLAVKDDPQLAKEWLVRAAEAGHAGAINLLGNPDEIRKFGLPQSGIDFNYWAERARVHFTSLDQNND